MTSGVSGADRKRYEKQTQRVVRIKVQASFRWEFSTPNNIQSEIGTFLDAGTRRSR